MEEPRKTETAESHKGLKQRKSYPVMIEDQYGDVDMDVGGLASQSVEMSRSSSGQSSMSFSKSNSSTAEKSLSKENPDKKTVPGQPINFGTIVPGLYRSSYPQESDYPFLAKLKLKTVITLVDKDLPETFAPFMRANSIQHCHITMEGTKKHVIPLSTIKRILGVVHDPSNHPLLIHCNHGRHRTGCVVALIRKMQKWDLDRVLDEYKAYASPKIRDCDVEYITKFQTADIEHLALAPLGEMLPIQPRSIDSRRLRFLVPTFFLVFIWYNFVRRFWPIDRQTEQRNRPFGL